MTTIREQLREGAHGWLTLATGLPDGRVIPGDDKGPEPDRPYLTYKFTTLGIPQGTDEEVWEDDGDGGVNELIRGAREGTLSVHAFGEGAYELLAVVYASLFKQLIRDYLTDTGKFSVVPQGTPNNLSALEDTEIEQHFQRDFEVYYLLAETDGDKLVGMSEYEHETTYDHRDEDPDPLVETHTEEV